MNSLTKKIFISLISLLSINCIAYSEVDINKVYSALSDSSLEKINTIINLLDKQEQTSLNKAYIGTLLMKKSELMEVPTEKINLFKKGTKILEDEINNNSENIEFRFLRLIIQEHSPKILKYNNIESDRILIIEGFTEISIALQKIILDYSKTSNIIKEADLLNDQ